MSLSPSVNDAGLMNVAGAVRVRDEATSTRRADPTLPAVLRIGPGLLLDLEPPPRRPGLVQTRLILGDVALVAAFDHLRPRLQAVLREPSYREDQVVVGDGILQPSAAFAERTPGQVVAVAME